jgi:farnesyl-diphosphate farnesyltransferase
MAPASSPLQLLKPVSRSFYLTLRVLPREIRKPIGLAYLLARTTDTIADTDVLPPEQRWQALEQLRRRLAGGALPSAAPIDFTEFIQGQGSAPERQLLQQTESSLRLLNELPPPDSRLVREVLDTITSGQQLDLRRFAGASQEKILALQSDAELEDYTYRVAGCVGEFWTKICRQHLFPSAALDEEQLLKQGVRFGQGLQLVNILRDLAADLRQGRCYLPEPILAAAGLQPQDLLNPVNEPRLRPVYQKYLDSAHAHLLSGWDYTNNLPRKCIRVRLACAWPILIGLETLRLLRSNNALDPQQRSKVDRRKVRSLMVRSVMLYPAKNAWKRMVAADVRRL